MKNSSFRSILAALIAPSIVLFFFTPNFLKGKIPIPADNLLGLYHPWRDQVFEGYNPGKFPAKNPLVTDPILQAYPWRHLTIENFKKGRLPLWNPYSFAGQPLLANIQSSPFQIFNLSFFILPFKIAWAVQVILPPVLTALFMYLFLKSRGLSTMASVFGAMVLPFSGFFIAWLSWGTIISTVMWLPLILLLIDKLLVKRPALYFLIAVLATSQIIFSGHWQAAFYVLLTIFLYQLFSLIKFKNWRLFFWPTLAIILGISLASVQILPALEFLGYSARELDQGYYLGRRDWFIPLQNLIQAVAPDFFGNPATYNYWGIWNWAEFASFVGIIPLTLALFALIKKIPDITFFVILLIIALVFGLENPISKSPYLLKLPLISSMQPSRIVFLLIFALTSLAAYGLNLWLSEKSKLKMLLPSLLIFLIIFILLIATFNKSLFPSPQLQDPSYIATRNLILPAATVLIFILISLVKIIKPSKVIIALIFMLTIFELYRATAKFLPFSKFSWIFPTTQSLSYLQHQDRPFRVMTTDRRILHPNTSSVYGIESVDGYDPLYLSTYASLITSWQQNLPNITPASFNRIITVQKYDSKLTNLLNVKYILTFDQLNDPNLTLVFQEGITRLYENQKALPRAFFVDEVIQTSNDQEELANLLDPNIDIKNTALSQQISFTKKDINAQVKFVTYTDQSMILESILSQTAPLFISNVYYPGWQLYIDNQKSPIYKANFMFQLALIPEGRHLLEFKFQPKSFYNGLYISLFALALTLLSSVYLWRHKSQS